MRACLVSVCLRARAGDLQPDSTTKELRWQVPTQTLYVSITVILLACPNCTKPSSFRAPNQGQPGLAASNPIRSSTMITKPSDTGCQHTLSRQPYLADPWLQSHWRGLVHFKLCDHHPHPPHNPTSRPLCLPLFPPFDFFGRLVWFISQPVWMRARLKLLLHVISCHLWISLSAPALPPFHVQAILCACCVSGCPT